MKIFSLNIWFSDYLKLQRTKILYKYLIENDFDVILLQEVTLPVLSILYKKINEKYPHIHLDIEENFYGVCIISKFEILDREILKFENTKMRRSIIYGKINNIIFATTHLESEFGKICDKKIDQFNNSIALLSKFDKVCLIGDTNLTPKNDKHLILNDFKDIYLEIDKTKETKTLGSRRVLTVELHPVLEIVTVRTARCDSCGVLYRDVGNRVLEQAQ